MNKSAAERIPAFLEYATPRLEYIAQSTENPTGNMRKQASVDFSEQFPLLHAYCMEKSANWEEDWMEKEAAGLQLGRRLVVGGKLLKRNVRRMWNKWRAGGKPQVPGTGQSIIPAATSSAGGSVLNSAVNPENLTSMRKLIGVGVGAGVVGGGLGHWVGHGYGKDAGREEMAQEANAMYGQLMQQWMNNYQQSNGDILSRLGNLFSPPDVSSIFTAPSSSFYVN